MSSRFPAAGLFARAMAGALLISAMAVTALATPPASAGTVSGSATVTYTANITVPAPPASGFSGAASGDGWAVALSSTQVFNVFHHQNTLQVDCHNQVDASECTGYPKTVIDTSNDDNFSSPSQPGLWLDQATGHLYVYGTDAILNTAGVVCIDTTSSATNPFCGYTQLATNAPTGDFSDSQVGNPVSFNGLFFAMNNANTSGASTGQQNTLMCFSEITLSACSNQPYAINLGTGSNSIVNNGYPSPAIAVFGTDLIIPIDSAAGGFLACFNASTGGSCGGSWPIASPAGYPPGGSESYGTPIPMLNGSNGIVTGLCVPVPTPVCYDLTGASATTPPGLAALVAGSVGWNGGALALGARIYIPVGDGGTGDDGAVSCYDYAAQAACAGFGTNGIKTLTPSLRFLYTVNPDPQRPTCIWVNSDGGTSQIQNFDAYTGGACGAGAIRVLASSVVVPQQQCIPSNYTSLQILSPGRSTYTSATITFEDFNGNPIAGIPPENVDSTGSVNLAPLHLTTQTPLPQFLITITGGGTINSVQVKLTWVGTFSTDCVGTNTVSGTEGYRLAASDGGVFSFGSDSFNGSMADKALDAPIVGIASTADRQGYWLAGRDGGVFSFGDANFHGSAVGHTSASIVGIASDPAGDGYWLAGADGSVFAYGAAKTHGSLVGHMLGGPIVGIAATPDGNGYWLAGADGGVYAFGDAHFKGSMAGHTLQSGIVGIASTSDGGGYWLAGGDGGVFAFGDAVFHGSAAALHLTSPIDGIAASNTGGGYWLGAADGGVFGYGDAKFLGCMANSKLNAPEVSISI